MECGNQWLLDALLHLMLQFCQWVTSSNVYKMSLSPRQVLYCIVLTAVVDRYGYYSMNTTWLCLNCSGVYVLSLSQVRCTALVDTEFNAVLNRSRVRCSVGGISDSLSSVCWCLIFCLAEPNTNTSHGCDQAVVLGGIGTIVRLFLLHSPFVMSDGLIDAASKNKAAGDPYYHL